VTHGLAVTRFLQGKTKIKMSEIVDLIYSHKHSAPSLRSTQYHERHASFSPSISPVAINHAHPSLFTRATTDLVGNHVHQEIHKLTMKDDDTQLRASTNGRAQRIALDWLLGRLWGNLALLDFVRSTRRAPVSWYLTESMAASHKNGAVITKRRRPPSHCTYFITTCCLIMLSSSI
jgi:hypothetical protein